MKVNPWDQSEIRAYLAGRVVALGERTTLHWPKDAAERADASVVYRYDGRGSFLPSRVEELSQGEAWWLMLAEPGQALGVR